MSTMDCGHGGYQCTAPVVLNGPKGPIIMVPMWCPRCGAMQLRIPQLNSADRRVNELLTNSAPGDRLPTA